MSNQSNDTLQRAYNLIESEDYHAAKTLLDDYLAENPDDTEAWWLYSHAVDDVDEAKKALQHVVTNDDEFSEASELLQELEDSQSLQPVMEQEPDFLSNLDEEIRSATTRDEEDFGDDFDFEDDDDEVETSSFRNRQLLAGLVFVIFIVVIGFVFLSGGGINNNSVTPTAEATVVADNGSGQSVGLLSDEVVNSFYATLTEFDVIEDSASIDTTSEGSTFNISICSTNNNADIRANVTASLQNMSQEIENLPEDIDAIGIRLIHCNDNNSMIRFIAVSDDLALQYFNGDINDIEFSTGWEAQPIN